MQKNNFKILWNFITGDVIIGIVKPSGWIYSHQTSRVGSLPKIWLPNTRKDLYGENGNLLQQNWYGSDGRIIWYCN